MTLQLNTCAWLVLLHSPDLAAAFHSMTTDSCMLFHAAGTLIRSTVSKMVMVRCSKGFIMGSGVGSGAAMVHQPPLQGGGRCKACTSARCLCFQKHIGVRCPLHVEPFQHSMTVPPADVHVCSMQTHNMSSCHTHVLATHYTSCMQLQSRQSLWCHAS